MQTDQLTQKQAAWVKKVALQKLAHYLTNEAKALFGQSDLDTVLTVLRASAQAVKNGNSDVAPKPTACTDLDWINGPNPDWIEADLSPKEKAAQAEWEDTDDGAVPYAEDFSDSEEAPNPLVPEYGVVIGNNESGYELVYVTRHKKKAHTAMGRAAKKWHKGGCVIEAVPSAAHRAYEAKVNEGAKYAMIPLSIASLKDAKAVRR